MVLLAFCSVLRRFLLSTSFEHVVMPFPLRRLAALLNNRMLINCRLSSFCFSICVVRVSLPCLTSFLMTSLYTGVPVLRLIQWACARQSTRKFLPDGFFLVVSLAELLLMGCSWFLYFLVLFPVITVHYRALQFQYIFPLQLDCSLVFKHARQKGWTNLYHFVHMFWERYILELKLLSWAFQRFVQKEASQYPIVVIIYCAQARLFFRAHRYL